MGEGFWYLGGRGTGLTSKKRGRGRGRGKLSVDALFILGVGGGEVVVRLPACLPACLNIGLSICLSSVDGCYGRRFIS